MADRTVERGPEQPDRRRESLLTTALSQVRRDPLLLVPFGVAGLVLTLVDVLRHFDPIPVVERQQLLQDGLDIRVEFAGYPRGVSQREVLFESLVGLRLPYFVWGVGLHLLTVLALTGAIVATISRVEDTEPGRTEWGRVFAYILLADGASRVVGSVTLLSVFPIALGSLVVAFLVFVRLFAVPGLLVQGHSVWAALGESTTITKGSGWQLFGVILLLGLSAWVLADTPYVGTLVSTAVVAPVHTVAIAVFLRRGPRDSYGRS